MMTFSTFLDFLARLRTLAWSTLTTFDPIEKYQLLGGLGKGWRLGVREINMITRHVKGFSLRSRSRRIQAIVEELRVIISGSSVLLFLACVPIS
jgi:hypothetical protein